LFFRRSSFPSLSLEMFRSVLRQGWVSPPIAFRSAAAMRLTSNTRSFHVLEPLTNMDERRGCAPLLTAAQLQDHFRGVLNDHVQRLNALITRKKFRGFWALAVSKKP
jgi:hypothetical protein